MNRPRLRSLRSRLFVATAAAVALSVGLSFAIAAVLTRRSVEGAQLDDLAHQADLLAAREREAVAPLFHLEGAVADVLRAQGGRYRVVSLRRPTPYLTNEERALLRAERDVQGDVTVAGVRYLFAARPVSNKGFVLLRPARLGATAWRPYFQALLVAALVGATLAAVASLLLARRIARPLRSVAGAARRLARGESPDPLPVDGAEELATLSASFNHMAAQLARAREAERSFLLSVSHELKTPLTAIRGYAEGLSEGAFVAEEAGETIAREAQRLERLVRDLLDLARMNKSEFSVHSQRIDLGDVAQEVVRRYEAQARSFGAALETTADGDAPAIGDPDRVLQVVSNLVENALRLTPHGGGCVRIEVRPGAITVEDNGPGLRPEELPRAFERFFLYSRYGRERPVGTGLGLAIVKELTAAMGGNVEVRSEPGRSTRFTVRLPAPPRHDGTGARPRARDLAPTARG